MMAIRGFCAKCVCIIQRQSYNVNMSDDVVTVEGVQSENVCRVLLLLSLLRTENAPGTAHSNCADSSQNEKKKS